METPGDPREAVTSPAVTERNGDRDRIGPFPTWNAIEVANEVDEEVVGIQFFDDQLHQRARPGELRAARREGTHCTRTKLRPPPLGIEVLFRPSGVFELTIDVDEDRTDLAHGCTSPNHGARNAQSRADNLRRAWAARAVTVCVEKGRVGMCPHGEGPGSVDRGQEATGGAVESEASILPRCALTETCQPLHVAPD